MPLVSRRPTGRRWPFPSGPSSASGARNDALVARGALVLPLGGMSSRARLELICGEQATIVCCTPSYALHLASLAAENGIDLAQTCVRAVIVAGEPGGSIPAVRQRIESAWHADVIDHAGATEIGPWGYASSDRQGLHIVESEFIAEFFTLADDHPAAAGELAELVLTTLGRYGAPVIRYRTGDLVRPRFDHANDNHFVWLEGGLLGRVDDMMIVRGVNVYPSAIEQILREFPAIEEFRLTVRKKGDLDALSVEVEDGDDNPARIAEAIRLRLGLQAEVRNVPAGSLPRFELKGRRFVDQRS